MGSSMNSLIARAVAASAGVVVIVGGVGLGMWADSSAGHAALVYQQKRHALDASIGAAERQGFTPGDLAPVTSGESALDRGTAPWWLPSRTSYYEGLTARVGGLDTQLADLERRIVDQTRADVAKQSDAARASIARAQQANAPDPDVHALQQRLDTVARAQGAAHTVKDYRAADQQAQGVAHDAAALASSAQQESRQVQLAAQQLVAQSSDLGAIQQAGQQAIANANNDGSVIAYLAREIQFKGAEDVARDENLLGKYAPLVGSADVNQAALGTAAAQRYGAAIRQALVAGLPAKAVIISFQDQHLWSFEHGQMVKDTPVTTGIRGVSDIGTDFGPMKVLRKSHPFTMQSPWPKTSPYWYPDTVVQWTTFFTNTGESIHDASWEPDSLLGPGSQYNASTRSHGCVHVPFATAEWMYNWADLGMPVIVYPGDGSPIANQLSLITTDDQGNPKSVPH